MARELGTIIIKESEASQFSPEDIQSGRVTIPERNIPRGGDSSDLLEREDVRGQEVFGDLSIRQQDEFNRQQAILKAQADAARKAAELAKQAAAARAAEIAKRTQTVLRAGSGASASEKATARRQEFLAKKFSTEAAFERKFAAARAATAERLKAEKLAKEKITVTDIPATVITRETLKSKEKIRGAGFIPTVNIQEELSKQNGRAITDSPIPTLPADAGEGGIILKQSEAAARGGTTFIPTAEVSTDVRFTQLPKVKKVVKIAKKVFSPFGGEDSKFVVVGGKFIPKEDFEKLDPSVQKLIFVTQPESILASTQFPKPTPITQELAFKLGIEPTVKPTVGVKFTGVSSQTEEGITTTQLQFETTTGQRGGALGASKQVGQVDDLAVIQTDVVGASGRRVIDLTGKSPKVVLKDVEKFVGTEGSLIIREGKKFGGISAGKISTADDIVKFKAVGLGSVDDATTSLFGVSQTDDALGISGGQIKDISKLDDTSGVSFIKTGTGKGSGFGKGSGGGSAIQTSSQTAQEAASRAATEAAVRAAVNVPKDTIAVVDVIAPTVVASGGLISKTDTKQVPSMIDMGSQIERPKVDKSFTGFAIGETPQETQIDKPLTGFAIRETSKEQPISQQPAFIGAVKEEQKLGTKQLQVTKQQVEIKQIQTLTQPQETRQRQAQTIAQMFKQKQLQGQATRQATTQKVAKPITPITPISLGQAVSQVTKKVKETGGFEAVGIRFGQEVSLLKGTKKQVTKKLQTFLTSTLGASGFLTQAGKKIKAKETGLLKKAGFRKSKVDPFKIVERKEKRIKKRSQEAIEIQMFKKGKKKKKGASLFGI